MTKFEKTETVQVELDDEEQARMLADLEGMHIMMLTDLERQVFDEAVYIKKTYGIDYGDDNAPFRAMFSMGKVKKL